MKRKINIDRPKISSEEINQRKNFESVIHHKPHVGAKAFFKKPWFLSSAIVVAVAVVTSIVVLNKQPVSNVQLGSTKNQQDVSDSIGLIAFYKSESEKPCIHPPIAGLNIPYTIYKVDAEKGGKLDFKTGSILTIPKHLFVDSNGKQLNGEIELRYREFHDPVDFFLSGIPMTYDSAGIQYHFESAGMIEMLAFQNGHPVEIAKGKTIKVEMASDYEGTQYNLYELDTNANNWACLGKDRVYPKLNKPAAKSDSTKTIASLKASSKYIEIEAKKAVVQKEIDKKIASLPKMEDAPLKPVKSRKEKFTFNIEVDPQEYPELVVYKGLLFEVGDENKNFKKEMYAITWDAATIKDGTLSGINYQLTLEKGSKKYTLMVYPVFEGNNYETAMKNFQNKFSKYTDVLTSRIEKEKKITAEYSQKITDYKNEQIEMERLWKQQEDNEFKAMNTQDKVVRMFQISHFGIFNSDCPSSYPQGVLCSAKLETEQGRTLRCYEVFLIDKQRNGIFTYARNPITNFSFNPKSSNLLWAVESGRLYWLKSENFKSISNAEGIQNVKLSFIEKKFTDSDEMKAFFGI